MLLDGLDEVAREPDRRAIAEWIERQIDRYPSNHFLVTSRPHGYRSAVLRQASVVTIHPFTAEQVKRFLHGWYLATERVATAAGRMEMPAVRLRAEEAAEDLIARLRAAPALGVLTVNPLLLTMIANVHRYRGALPGSRADLYGEICQVMLSRRLEAKHLPEQLSWQVKEKLLTRLAFQMMSRRVRDLPREQALGILGPGLRRLPQQVSGNDFLDTVCINGFLVEREHGQYAFAHLTFQEYLASQHIRENSLVNTLIDAVGDDWWRETTLLYAATSNADPIVSACLDNGSTPALALAFDCVDAGHELAPELYERLDRVKAAAFEDGCDPAHRQLVAAVLATRLTRQVVTTASGARVCTQPVPAGLYWLFLQDTPGTPAPDAPCDRTPEETLPVTSVWGSEAMALVTWLNKITSDSTQVRFRLPTHAELDDQSVAGALVLPDTNLARVTAVWTHPVDEVTPPGTWIPPGRPDPHLVTAATLRQAVAADANYLLLQQLAELATRALNRASALDRNPDLARAWDLARDFYLALDRVRDPDPDLIRTLALDPDPDLIRAHVRAHVRAHALDLDRALDPDLIRARDRAGSFLLAVMSWALGDPLGTALYHALTAPGAEYSAKYGYKRAATEAGERFATALLTQLGVSDSVQIKVPLDGSLAAKVQAACAGQAAQPGLGIGWDPAKVAEHLAASAGSMLERHQPPTASATVGIRTAALTLADVNRVSQGDDRQTFITLAAAVTLLQQRASGHVPLGESVVLAFS